MKTVAVIPAYNEEFTIGSVVALSRRYVDEVVVVDDGSTDNTPWIAATAGAVVVSQKQNMGKGFALKNGFEKALSDGGELIIALDADGEHHPKDIPKLVKPVADGQCDVTIGVRYVGGRGKTPVYRRLGQKILDAQTNMIAGSRFTDTQSGFRCFSRKALMGIIPASDNDYNGFEIESFMLIRAIKNNLEIMEIPIEPEYKKNTPVMSPFEHGTRVLVSLIHIVGREHILLSFGSGSILSFLLAVFLALRTIDLVAEMSEWPYGTIILTAIFFLIGVYLSTTGLTLFMMQEMQFRTHTERVKIREK